MSRVAVSHWETSRTLPDVQSVLPLADHFGTTVDELLRGGGGRDVRDGREERAEDKDFRGGIGVLVTGDVLLDPASFRKLAVAITAAAVVLLAFWAIGRRRRG